MSAAVANPSAARLCACGKPTRMSKATVCESCHKRAQRARQRARSALEAPTAKLAKHSRLRVRPEQELAPPPWDELVAAYQETLQGDPKLTTGRFMRSRGYKAPRHEVALWHRLDRRGLGHIAAKPGRTAKAPILPDQVELCRRFAAHVGGALKAARQLDVNTATEWRYRTGDLGLSTEARQLMEAALNKETVLAIDRNTQPDIASTPARSLPPIPVKALPPSTRALPPLPPKRVTDVDVLQPAACECLIGLGLNCVQAIGLAEALKWAKTTAEVQYVVRLSEEQACWALKAWAALPTAPETPALAAKWPQTKAIADAASRERFQLEEKQRVTEVEARKAKLKLAAQETLTDAELEKHPVEQLVVIAKSLGMGMFIQPNPEMLREKIRVRRGELLAALGTPL